MTKRIQERAHLIAENGRFQTVMLAVILLNALIIGLETYAELTDEVGDVFTVLNEIFLGLFTVEIVIRLTAYLRHPWDFFRRGWNIFDFSIVAAAYLPFVRESVTLLRLARLLRVARLLEVIPGMRVIVLGITRSLKPIGGLAALTFFLLYVYGVIGWMLFHEGDPKHWGNIGDAMLTLFQVLTLEGWNEVLEQVMAINSWSWIYLVSFVLIATFVVLNIVIAIVVSSIEEAREIEEKRLFELEFPDAADEGAELRARIGAVRTALDALEHKI